MRKIKNHLTYSVEDRQQERNTQPSKTIPDQTMSVQEIMDRFARGLPIDGAKLAIYHGEEDDMPDLERMDLSEKHELLEAARKEVEEQRKKLNRMAEAKRRRQWTKPKNEQENPSKNKAEDGKDDQSTKTS